MEYNKELLKAIPEYKEKDSILEWANRVEKIAIAAGVADFNNSKKQDSLLYTACLSKLTGDVRKIADTIDFSWTALRDTLISDLGQDSDERALEAMIHLRKNSDGWIPYIREMERLAALATCDSGISIRLVKIQLKNSEFGRTIRREVKEKKINSLSNMQETRPLCREVLEKEE
eukprot:TRINITY_DN1898_c0_g1_i18.p2 TRINITY_DN1898_c0_g1~~TRINITY_DN1898_c0_g1_i18.p2  ORF type:complete len:174 (-),score=31.01 TRINITY_DN1898_c0_g1_i18:2253-2774(-)